MGNLYDRFIEEEKMQDRYEEKHTILDLDDFSKLSLLQDTYGTEEVLAAFVDYLRSEDYATFNTILNDMLKEGMANGELE